ncbi:MULTISPECIES: type II toxin-antitoxin system RelB/DinJ family antitoxin [Bifidobacterium]|uniref:Translation repressor RelB n=1 Tax=Bifidobacterium callitrichidarum TaxID=2052941 RepID=A0A2U2N1Y7_9BIFI|nr:MULTISPECIES: type II toxin-antitoxin system RelB/DinJ family antitoxin [Bifidobacterium]MBT1169846.1 type II toxin-antitoxin system RelB/DinJ family antitoxin [Bifidobacterium sp. SO4]MBW3090815.1 type II toxin-antitoxin system RelB/DinJ family antitoxin [Bifidobacterium miconisargentati]PWG63019.1 translation repressor RelB [Bifidobacterium callitrichidarum]
MVTSTYRVDADLKKQAAELYESMGMSLNTAINVFLRQSVKEQRMPFQPSAAPVAPALPEAGTVAANGVVYQGLDDRGYPIVSIPGRMIAEPKRDADGTPVLPQSWKD